MGHATNCVPPGFGHIGGVINREYLFVWGCGGVVDQAGLTMFLIDCRQAGSLQLSTKEYQCVLLGGDYTKTSLYVFL